MVAGCRDVGGRCIKARGLPGLSQQPGAVTEPLELGRDAQKTGPGDQGSRDARPRRANQEPAGRIATLAIRAELFQPLAFYSRSTRTF